METCVEVMFIGKSKKKKKLIHLYKKIKKRQQRAQMILDSLEIPYNLIDVTEPGNEKERNQMQAICKKREPSTTPLPPQFFNDDEYCGDYEDFDAANDEDKVKIMLKLEPDFKEDDIANESK